MFFYRKRFLGKILKIFILTFVIGFLCAINLYFTTNINKYIEIAEFKSEIEIEKKKPYEFKITTEILNKKFLENSLILNKIVKKSNNFRNVAEYNSCHNLKYKSDLKFNKDYCDLFITVKTTKLNHETKLKPIIETWFNFVRSKVSYLVSFEFFIFM